MDLSKLSTDDSDTLFDGALRMTANSRFRMIESIFAAEHAEQQLRQTNNLCLAQTDKASDVAVPLPTHLARQVHGLFDRIVFLGDILKW